MHFHELVQMLACMVRLDGYKGDVILHDCNVTCFHLFPCLGVIVPKVMHVRDVSWPESLVFDPIKCEELAQLLSGLKMKLKVCIPGCSDKQQDCFHSL